MQPHRIHIGTSGWHYDHWRGPFFPEKLPKGKWLDHYTRRFQTVEVNNSFYRLPDETTLDAWKGVDRAGFTFAVKASRTITHFKKLKDPRESLNRFFERVQALDDKLGPVLFQLPPRWHLNVERLEAFLKALPEGFRCAFEFRDQSWYDARVLRLLARHGAAFCIYEMAGHRSPKEVTADFVYIRLHGPTTEPYRGRYDTRTLAGWAGAFSSWTDRGLEVFCYFDNDEKGYAAQDALKLQEMTNG